MVSIAQIKEATQIVGPQKIPAKEWFRLGTVFDLSGGGVSLPAMLNLTEIIDYVYVVTPTWAAIGYLQDSLKVPTTGVWDCPTAQAWAKATGQAGPEPRTVVLWIEMNATLRSRVKEKTGLDLMRLWFTTGRGSTFRPPAQPPNCPLSPPAAPPLPPPSALYPPAPVPTGLAGIGTLAQFPPFMPLDVVPGPIENAVLRAGMVGEAQNTGGAGAAIVTGLGVLAFIGWLIWATEQVPERRVGGWREAA